MNARMPTGFALNATECENREPLAVGSAVGSVHAALGAGKTSEAQRAFNCQPHCWGYYVHQLCQVNDGGKGGGCCTKEAQAEPQEAGLGCRGAASKDCVADHVKKCTQ